MDINENLNNKESSFVDKGPLATALSEHIKQYYPIDYIKVEDIKNNHCPLFNYNHASKETSQTDIGQNPPSS